MQISKLSIELNYLSAHPDRHTQQWDSTCKPTNALKEAQKWTLLFYVVSSVYKRQKILLRVAFFLIKNGPNNATPPFIRGISQEKGVTKFLVAFFIKRPLMIIKVGSHIRVSSSVPHSFVATCEERTRCSPGALPNCVYTF